MSDSNSMKSVEVERTLDAPVDQVWKMWTESENFKKWYGPTGASIPKAEIDLKVGGTRHVCMEMDTPNGPMQMWFVGEHKEIIENERLVYSEAMSDSEANILDPASMGMPEGANTSTEVVVVLNEVDGKTNLSMQHIGVPHDSPGAMGWNMAIEKLEEYFSG